MDRDYFWLDDGQFARLTPRRRTAPRGNPRADDRRVISGIVYVLKSGCRWADVPEVYGPRKTLYNRFVRWAAKDAILAILGPICVNSRMNRRRFLAFSSALFAIPRHPRA